MLDAVGSKTKLSWGLCRPAEQKTGGAARSSFHLAGKTKRSAAERSALGGCAKTRGATSLASRAERSEAGERLQTTQRGTKRR